MNINQGRRAVETPQACAETIAHAIRDRCAGLVPGLRVTTRLRPGGAGPMRLSLELHQRRPGCERLPDRADWRDMLETLDRDLSDAARPAGVRDVLVLRREAKRVPGLQIRGRIDLLVFTDAGVSR
jgi:hypothetical protein